jgi:hypothetical protein
MNTKAPEFSATIELLIPWTVNDNPRYMKVATFLSDLRLSIGEDLDLELDIKGDSYKLIAKVCKIQKHVVTKENQFQIRYFLESENRKEVVEMWDSIKRHNPNI